MVRSASDILLISRFGLAGVANTLVGLSVIAVLDLGLSVDPPIANAAGYLAGFATSYFLNRRFVFQNAERAGVTGPRYLVATAMAFASNQVALAISAHLLGKGEAARLTAQLTAMATYTLVLFVGCRFWVFAPGHVGSVPPGGRR